MNSIGRRDFVTTSLAAAAAAAVSRGRVVSASDRITVAILGLGNRGTSLVRSLSRRKDVSIAWVCDVDTARFERALGIMDSAGVPSPKTAQDFQSDLPACRNGSQKRAGG